MAFYWRSVNFVCIILVIFVVSFRCAKESEHNVSQPKSPSAEMHAEGAHTVKPSLSKENESSFFLTTQLKSLLLQPIEKAKDRLLEYNVDLSYQCDDFHKSRQQVVHIISKYGFIRSAKTEVRHSAYMIVTAAIDAHDIYKFLVDMDKVGQLVSENILVTDLTENMVIAQRKMRREEMRIERQKRASAKISAQSKNWKDVEDALLRSEERYDSSEHEKWKVIDRVKWANVTVRLEPYSSIKVPPYKNALIKLVEIILWIPYVLIIILPFILGGLIAWKTWRWLRKLIKN